MQGQVWAHAENISIPPSESTSPAQAVGTASNEHEHSSHEALEHENMIIALNNKSSDSKFIT